MGNEPGPLPRHESSIVVLKMTGPVSAETAQDFKEALEALIAKYKHRMGDLERPIKHSGPEGSHHGAR